MADSERNALRMKMLLSIVVAGLLDSGLVLADVVWLANDACLRWERVKAFPPTKASEICDRMAVEVNRLAEEAAG